MADTTIRRLARTRAIQLRRGVGEQLAEARAVAEVSQRELAVAAGIDRSVLSRAERGEANLTLDGLAAVSTALGLEASVRLYPATGPRVRDHVQLRMIEPLAERLDPRWRLRLEVPVWRPVRGVIDLVLVDRAEGTIVSGEAHGELRRVEIQLRRAAEKTDALASATGWPWGAEGARVCRLLVLRNCRAMRELVGAVLAVFEAAYPGRCEEAVAALTGPGRRFPDAAIAWVDVDGGRTRLLAGPPRGIGVGR